MLFTTGDELTPVYVRLEAAGGVPPPYQAACDSHRIVLRDPARGHTTVESAGSRELLLVCADAIWFSAVERIARVAAHTVTPVVLWMRESSAACRVAAYKAGATDVLAAEIHPVEFAVRLRAATHRAAPGLARPSVQLTARTGIVTVSLTRREVRSPQGPVTVSALQWRLLATLVAQVGQAQSHQALCVAMWGMVDDAANRHALRTHVSALRRRLDLRRETLRAVHGYGYVLDAAATADVGPQART